MRARVLTLAVALLVAAAPPVQAHSEVPGLRTVLDEVEPAVAGLEVAVSAGSAAQLRLTNRGPDPVEVLDEEGTPFLRIAARGVEANLAAAAWYRTATPEGDGRVPEPVATGAPVRWAQISDEPTWAWYDHRLHPGPVAAATQPDGRGVVRLDEWRVPLRVGARAVEVRGHRELLRPGGALASTLLPREPAPGIRVGVVDGPVPAVSVVVAGDVDVVVIGQEGEPMARVLDGVVEVNRASPTWLVTAAASGEVPAGAVGASEPPRWERVGPGRALTWLEPRAVYEQGVPPAEVLQRDAPTVLRSWEVPLEVDGRRVVLTGSTSWAPADVAGEGDAAVGAEPSAPAGDGSRSLPGRQLAAVLASVLLLAVAATVLRRRRSWPTGERRR